MHKGKFLKQLLKKGGYTQNAVATELKTTQSFVSQSLGAEEPTDKFIQDICNILGISIDEFNQELNKEIREYKI